MKATKEKCNDWECEHNKDGYCESIEALTECNDKLLEYIHKLGRLQNEPNR